MIHTVFGAVLAALYVEGRKGETMGTVKIPDRTTPPRYPLISGKRVTIYRHAWMADFFGMDLFLEVEDTSWNLTPHTSDSLVQITLDDLRIGFIMTQDLGGSRWDRPCFVSNRGRFQILRAVYAGDFSVFERASMMLSLSGVDLRDFCFTLLPKSVGALSSIEIEEVDDPMKFLLVHVQPKRWQHV